MMLKVLSGAVLLGATSSSAASVPEFMKVFSKDHQEQDKTRFRADSSAGRKLLRHAKVLEAPPSDRKLNYNYYNNNGGNRNVDLADMYIKFQGCSSYEDRGLDYYEYWQEYHSDNSEMQEHVDNWEEQQAYEQMQQDWYEEQQEQQQAYQNWKYYQQQQAAKNYDNNNNNANGNYNNANYNNANANANYNNANANGNYNNANYNGQQQNNGNQEANNQDDNQGDQQQQQQEQNNDGQEQQQDQQQDNGAEEGNNNDGGRRRLTDADLMNEGTKKMRHNSRKQHRNRHLGNYNADNYNYGNNYANGENDWEYNIEQYENDAQDQQQQQQAQDGYQQVQQQQDEAALEYVHLVRFTLCYDNGCGSCAGKYAVDRNVFLQAWWEHQQLLQANTCEQTRANCDCSNNQYNKYYQTDNYYNALQQCYNTCYKKAGQYSCLNYDGNQNNQAFDLSNYFQCGATQFSQSAYAMYQSDKNGNKNKNAGYYVEPNGNSDDYYYIGPYCSDNEELYLKAYTDNECTNRAEHFVFKADANTASTGSIPYMDKPMLSQGSCVSCQSEQNNNNDQYNKYNYQQQQDANGLCSLSQDDDAVSCVYVQNAANEMLYGCLFLDVLPELDGRNERARNALARKLMRQKLAAVGLSVVAFVLLFVLVSLCCCVKKPQPKTDKTEQLLGRDVRDDDSAVMKGTIA